MGRNDDGTEHKCDDCGGTWFILYERKHSMIDCQVMHGKRCHCHPGEVRERMRERSAWKGA